MGVWCAHKGGWQEYPQVYKDIKKVGGGGRFDLGEKTIYYSHFKKESHHIYALRWTLPPVSFFSQPVSPNGGESDVVKEI